VGHYSTHPTTIKHFHCAWAASQYIWRHMGASAVLHNEKYWGPTTARLRYKIERASQNNGTLSKAHCV
jgi:hypothetical protein